MSWLNKNCNLGATPHFQADPNRMNLTIYNYIFIVIHISIIIYIYIYLLLLLLLSLLLSLLLLLLLLFIYIYIYLYQSRETSWNSFLIPLRLTFHVLKPEIPMESDVKKLRRPSGAGCLPWGQGRRPGLAIPHPL